MSPNAVRVLAVIYCSLVTYCNANITAYVKEYLTSTTCVSVKPVPEVCNVDWKITATAAASYDETIQAISQTVNHEGLTQGLDASGALHCRRMYKNMVCKRSFPKCDEEKMIIDHGDGKARCNFANKACTTTSIEGCENAKVGTEPLISEPNKCEAITTNTSKLCPGTQVKVPSRYNDIAKAIVVGLSQTAELFSKELKNHTVSASCETKYREVLCRLIDACSPDGFYYLHYIDVSECEKLISCVKSAGFSEKITSVCSKIPSTEDTDNVTVPNPYVRAELPHTTATSTKSADAEILVTTNKDNSSNTRKDNERSKGNRGSSSKNYQNWYLLMILTLLGAQVVNELH